MKRVFVFDLDGTLIDSIEMINNCDGKISQLFNRAR